MSKDEDYYLLINSWRFHLYDSFFVWLAFVCVEFELRALSLLGKCSTTWATAPDHFCFSYFSSRVLWFYMLALDHNPPTYSLLCSSNDRCIPPCSAYLLRWGIATFWQGLASNHDPPDFCFPRSRDYRQKPLCLVKFYDFQNRINKRQKLSFIHLFFDNYCVRTFFSFSLPP
jgi:hypothetical protein